MYSSSILFPLMPALNNLTLSFGVSNILLPPQIRTRFSLIYVIDFLVNKYYGHAHQQYNLKFFSHSKISSPKGSISRRGLFRIYPCGPYQFPCHFRQFFTQLPGFPGFAVFKSIRKDYRDTNRRIKIWNNISLTCFGDLSP